MERELNPRDAIIEFLTKQRLSFNAWIKTKNGERKPSESFSSTKSSRNSLPNGIDECLANEKPDCLIIYARTNSVKNGWNALNQPKEIIKKVSPNTKIAFWSIFIWKDREKVVETNSLLKSYRSQKKIDLVENNNLKEEHLGMMKRHLKTKEFTLS